MSKTPTPGEVAHETYWRTFAGRPPTLPWEQLIPDNRAAWEAAAQAVLDQGQQRISLLYVVVMEAGDQLQLCGAYLSNEAAESHLEHARTLMPDRQFCVRVCPCALTARAPGWSPRAGPGSTRGQDTATRTLPAAFYDALESFTDAGEAVREDTPCFQFAVGQHVQRDGDPEHRWEIWYRACREEVGRIFIDYGLKLIDPTSEYRPCRMSDGTDLVPVEDRP